MALLLKMSCLVLLGFSEGACPAGEGACPTDETGFLQVHAGNEKHYYEYKSGKSGKGGKAGDYEYEYKTPTEPPHPTEAPAPSPPEFECEIAEPQSPRNVTPGYEGGKTPRVFPLKSINATSNPLLQANIHFHLGAEHYSEGQYDMDPPVTHSTDGGHDDPTPGYFCPTSDLSQEELKDYTFEHCEGTKVGNTYEFHWVFSVGAGLEVGGEPVLTDTLAGAFTRADNPAVLVRGQVCRIINDDTQNYDDFIHQWRAPDNAVRYMGSTTGTSYNNQVCSRAQVSWHVDIDCCTLSAQVLDETCRQMEEQGMKTDLEPHGSRELVAKELAADEAYELKD